MDTKKHKSAKSETPLMTQYNAIKAQHRDAILFFRMGDFFEMFNEDAKIGARVLGITLTSRGHGKAGNVPLAGFPHHALDGYLAKMIRAGYRVAICEQTEDPKMAKGIVKRDVIQVVTPGTVTDEKLLESVRNNYLSALCLSDSRCGMATVDVSTGEFTVTEFEPTKLTEEIHAIGPSEILISEEQEETLNNALDFSRLSAPVTKREGWIFSRDYGYEILTKHFGTSSLKGYGIENLHTGIAAAGAILTYLHDTQKTSLAHIQKISAYTDNDFMMLDPATRRNLEITSSMMGDDSGATLLSIIDKTRTSMGSRTLSAWIQRPLKKVKSIRERLDGIQSLLEAKAVRRELTALFKEMNDLERLISKVVMERANPRDLIALKKSLQQIPDITHALESIQTDQIKAIAKNLKPCKKVTQKIDQALTDEPPAVLANGNVIKKGFNKKLDELREIAFSGKDWIAQMQKSERDKTAISSLKVGYNKVFGYYIEVTKPHLSKIPEDYIRKQTLVNAERFITPQLKEMEEKILHAEEKISSLEQELFEQIRSFVAESADMIQENGRLIGQLDSLLSLAHVADEYRYTKPEVHEGSDIYIEEGRHPVVERRLPAGEPFIPNDVTLNNEDQILIITGPNMAGKSTYIRQVGLIVLLAQIGSFVPAKSASIGLVDRIFTRVGAQDNVAGGESTFLVEMNEAANILNNATPKSLILLDEIGRGTSTFDGLSIAWAVAEYLHNNPRVQAKTLFATHYHELTELSLILNRVKNYNVSVKEWGDHIVFLRKIVPGGCDHSYGIQVARLAGLPPEVISRAKEILNNLEANELTPHKIPKLAVGDSTVQKVAQPQLNIFTEEEKKIREELKELDLNNMTPMEAIKKIEELKKWISSS